MATPFSPPGPAPGPPPSWADSQRLLCDEMLVRLGRWLRAAGYDTAIAHGRGADRALLAHAAAEGRTLITRDRKILEIRDAGARTLVLGGGKMGDWAAALTRRLDIDWLKAPFSRCLVCNRVLDPVPEAAAARLPPRVRDLAPEATWCGDCDKLYWPGSHVARMRRRLEAWQRGAFS